MAAMPAAPYTGHLMEEFAEIEVIPEVWEEHLSFLRSLHTRGIKPPEGVLWQYDGQVWPTGDGHRQGPLKVGERVIVPLVVAEHGIKRTMQWPRDVDDHGLPLNKLDFHGARKPMLRILRMFKPADFVNFNGTPRVEIPSLCAWCGESVPPASYKEHVEEHLVNRTFPVAPQEEEKDPF